MYITTLRRYKNQLKYTSKTRKSMSLFNKDQLETEIVRMDENTTSSGGQDYSSSHNDCSLRMTCKAPPKQKIKAGSCSYT